MRRSNVNRACTAAVQRLAAQDGQVLLEYALILGLVALLTIGVLTTLGQSVSGLLNRTSSNMSSVMNP